MARLKLSPNLKIALPTLAVSWAVILFVALAVQQNYRLSANDPQLQLAGDAAAQLEQGAGPSAVVGAGRVDATRSLAPFVTVYDGRGDHAALASSGDFDGRTFTPPAGVFDNVRAHHEERFTWQTAGGQRLAAVMDYVNGDQPRFVLAARSLTVVEAREDQLRTQTLAALLGVAAVLGAFVLLVK
jgi:hypothetical protein